MLLRAFEISILTSTISESNGSYLEAVNFFNIGRCLFPEENEKYILPIAKRHSAKKIKPLVKSPPSNEDAFMLFYCL